nr:hypothetical protein [Desulfobacterales bacterium]
MLHNLVHGRFEIGTPGGESILARLISEDLIDIVSLMDHTPRYGQFKILEAYTAYHTRTCKATHQFWSHDDDTEGKASAFRNLRVDASEFPVLMGGNTGGQKIQPEGLYGGSESNPRLFIEQPSEGIRYTDGREYASADQ